MRTWAVGWAAGAWYLQRAADLPSMGWMVWLGCFAGVMVMGARLLEAGVGAGTGGRAQAPRAGAVHWRLYARVACLASGAMLAGYDWAAYRAHDRLSHALPLAWEGRDVRVRGRVEGLPVVADDGVRFLFRVDAVLSPLPTAEDAAYANATFASLLRLSWSAGRSRRFSKGTAAKGIAASGTAAKASPTMAPTGTAALAASMPKVVPGDDWIFTVRLKRPHANANFGGPDFEAWMLQHNIRATGSVRAASRVSETRRDAGSAVPERHWQDVFFNMRQGVERYRGALAQRIDAALPGAAHSGVVKALTIGEQGAIAKADWERFARTGTNHLVAISGLHVGLVAGFAAWLGGGAWRGTARTRWPLPLWAPAPRIAACCGLVAAGLFVALAGFGIPAQRAFWMLAAVFLAMLGGRSTAPSSLWCIALFLVVTVDPWSPLSAGFWLSFGAVGAILYAINARGRVVQASEDAGSAVVHPRYLPSKPLRGPARQPASVFTRKVRVAWPSVRDALAGATRAQCAVTIALIPATLGWFGQVPLLGPLANAFAIPWVSFLVVPAVLAGVIVPAPLDTYAFIAAHQLIAWLCIALDVFAAPQWALLRLPQPSTWAMCAAVIGVAVWLGPRGLRLQPLAPLLCLPLFIARPASLAEGDFRVTMMDIGQGNAALVETRHFRLMYDTGPPIGRSDAGERIILPALRAQGINGLDAMVVSHNHDDHYGGAASLLAQLPVRHFLASLPLEQPLWGHAQRAGVRAQRCQKGQSWQWNDVRFDVLWPPDPSLHAPPNTMSCVIRISNGRHVALLTGDIEAAQEAALMRSGVPLSAHVLMAPHHGSRTSSTARFVQAVAPEHVVFQVGHKNRHRHPHAHVVARYARVGAQRYRNDEDGAVRFVSKPSGVEVSAYRRVHRRYWMGK